MPNQPIQVILISGFLGAGKTTLLNHLLKSLPDKKKIVIENEFGDTPIDGQLISKQYNQLYELTDGCICCSIDSELENVLSEIIIKKLEVDYLFIETTGVADPGNVGAIFMQAEVQEYFTLNACICVVDAETVDDRLEEADEVRRQITFATDIVINKAANVREDYVKKLQSILAGINPFAKIYTTEDGAVHEPELLREKIFDLPKSLSTKQVDSLDHKHHHHHVHNDITAITYQTSFEFEKNELMHCLTVLLALHQHQIYRIKGFVRFAGEIEPRILQSAGKYLSLSSVDEEFNHTGKESNLVFIGKNIEQASIDRIMKPALAKIKRF
jgi:G3E family GTPase